MHKKPDFFRGVEYKASYVTVEACPSSAAIPAVAFTGRSNSGKSSLLSAVCDHKNLARTSSKAGKTRTINYFMVPPASAGGAGMYLVDLPGFGYAAISHSERDQLRAMVNEFIEKQKGVKLLIIVLDARREPGSEEIGVMQWCEVQNRPYLFAVTKWDKLNNKERSEVLHRYRELGCPFVPVSSTTKYGLTELIAKMRAKSGS